MKICILRHSHFPGDPRVRKEIYAHIEKGHSVDIISIQNDRKEKRQEVIDGINIFRLPITHKREGILQYFLEYSISFILFTISITAKYIKNKYDYIQVNTMPDFLIFSTFIVKALGAKVLLDLHEPTPELWETKFGKKLPVMYKLQRKLQLSAIKYAYKCLTVTEALRQNVISHGIDENKIIVVPNVSNEAFDKHYKENRAKKDKKPFKIITHGLIEERYGLDLIIKAVKELKDELNDIIFEIYGHGEYAENIKNLIIEEKLTDIILFKGYVSFEELMAGLNSADVGIISMKRSPYSELIDTNKMYEYISMGIPVIQADLPAVRINFDDNCLEYFEPDNYIDLKEKIKKLYHDPDHRNTLSKNALQKYNSFKWDISKENYLALFQ